MIHSILDIAAIMVACLLPGPHDVTFKCFPLPMHACLDITLPPHEDSTMFTGSKFPSLSMFED